MNSVFSVLVKRLNSLKTFLANAIWRIASRNSFSTFMKLQSSEWADSRGVPSLDIEGLDMCGLGGTLLTSGEVQ